MKYQGAPKTRPASRAAICLFLLGISFAATGCSVIGRFAEKRADKAAYGIISQKQEEAATASGDFTIEPVAGPAMQALSRQARRKSLALDTYTTPSYMLSLADTVAIAFAWNREFQTRKEALFTQALNLTEVRRDFGAIFAGSAGAAYRRSETGNAVPGGPLVERFGDRGFALGARRLLATGARVTLDFTHSFVHQFTPGSTTSASNNLSFSIVQPLLRAAGPLVTLEPLRQAERDMIYAVRDFRRAQQAFLITVASTYYSLLQSQDQLKNAVRNDESARENWERVAVLARGGRQTPFEVDQARQSALAAENSLFDTHADYLGQLDDFKRFLGIPIDLDCGPDPAELEIIAERGLLQPDMDLGKAIQIALNERLDLITMADRVEDAGRDLDISKQNFLPDLVARYEYSTSTSTPKDRIKLDFRDNQQVWGLDLGLPFDWTLRRNRHRRSIIAANQVLRDLQDLQDSAVLEVRDAWRELKRLSNTYRINLESRGLAERQVRSTSLYLQRGEALARDLLDAQDDLLAAQNALTSALVLHTIQRLRFWNAIERLEVDSAELWAR